MTFIRVIMSALMLTVFAAGATTIDAKRPEARSASASEIILTLIGASMTAHAMTANARMCDPRCRYRCC